MSARALAAVIALLVSATHCIAATPQLGAVLPRGGQRGTDVTVRLQGSRLADAREVVFHGQGITVKSLSAVNGGRVDVVLTIAPDCPIGAHGLRLLTATGISNLKTFHVGTLPEIAEAEPNGTNEDAQAIELDTTINGIAQREDLDMYVFEGVAGERVTAELEGFRLGDSAFDPHVAIIDSDGFELATSDDTALAWRDAIASVALPADGRYYVAVRESAYRGSGRCWYRLHVGRFPRPTAAFPAGGAPGTDVPVILVGDVTGTVERTISLPDPAAQGASHGGWIQPGVAAVEVTDDFGTAPSPIWMRLSALPEAFEVEPNNGRNQATRVAFPASINGVIERPGDVDRFLVELKKNQAVVVNVFARRLRSPLDSVLDVRRPDNSSRVGGDDNDGPELRSRGTCRGRRRRPCEPGHCRQRASSGDACRLATDEASVASPPEGSRTLAACTGRLRLARPRAPGVLDRESWARLRLSGVSALRATVDGDGDGQSIPQGVTIDLAPRDLWRP